MDPENRREAACPVKTLVLAWAGLMAVVFLTYGHSLSFGFLAASDDQAYIFRNPYLRELSWSNLSAIFTNVHFDSYLPATLASYSLDYTLWKFDPFGYHLTQILLHGTNSFLALAVLVLARVPLATALGAAFIYSVHPVHAESVVWISERKNLLSALFILVSQIFYVRHAREADGALRNLTIAWLAFILALLSKPVAVVLPLIFVLYDLCVAGRGLRLAEKIPFFAGSVLAAAGTILTQGGVGAIKEYAGGSFAVTALYMLRVYWDYLASLISPFSLSPYYYYARPVLWQWQSLLAYLLVPSAIAIAAARYRSRPLLAFAAGWFVLWLLPVSNIVPLATLRQDRYLYLPSFAPVVFMAAAVLNVRWIRSETGRALAVLGVLVLLLAGWTARYSYTFASERALWTRAADMYPLWSGAQFESGYQCWIEKDIPCASQRYRRAIEADPGNARALANLGALLIDGGDYAEARRYTEKALEADPDFADAYYNLAVIANKTGEEMEKIPQWREKYEGLKNREAKKDYRLGEFRYR